MRLYCALVHITEQRNGIDAMVEKRKAEALPDKTWHILHKALAEKGGLLTQADIRRIYTSTPGIRVEHGTTVSDVIKILLEAGVLQGSNKKYRVAPLP